MKKLKVFFYLSNSYCYLLLFFYFQLQYPQHQKKRNKILTTNPAETSITMMKTDIL